MAEIDPLSKIGVMLAIRKLAHENAGITDRDGMAALEWAINRGLIHPRPGVPILTGGTIDDLVLTSYGQQVAAAFWRREEARRRTRRAA